MPIKRVIKQGQPGYRYGDSGKTYTYQAGDPASRERARKKAERQAAAIKSRKGKK